MMDSKQDKTSQGGSSNKPTLELRELCIGCGQDVTLEKVDGWLEEAGLLGDNKEITKKDTAEIFEKHVNVKGGKTIDGPGFGKMMEELINKLNLDLQEVLDKLKKVIPKKKSSISGRMPPKEDRPK